MTKILIVGASSYLGARLYVDLKAHFEVAGTFHDNKLFPELVHLDITSPEEVQKVVSEQKPVIIIHVASNPFDKWCEKNPEQAQELNVEGTRSIVEAANKNNAKLIYISTTAAMHDKTVYARTKKAAEEESKKTKAGFLILRPSLIIGYSPNTTNDRPFNRLLRNIEGQPAEYDDTWHFKPTYLGHISEVIKETVKKNIWGETIPITVPERATRYQFARDILEPFGIKVLIKNNAANPPELDVSQDKLKELKLPQYTYKQMISKIIAEIQEKVIKK